MAEFTLKKRTTGQMESDRINDVDDNWGTIEAAIRGLQANASLFWEGTASQTPLELVEANYPNLPSTCMRLVTIFIHGYAVYGAIVFKYTNSNGKVVILSYLETGITVYRLRDGTWSEWSY